MMEAQINSNQNGYWVFDKTRSPAHYLQPDGLWQRGCYEYFPTRKAAQKMLDLQKLVRKCTLAELDTFAKEREIRLDADNLGWETMFIHVILKGNDSVTYTWRARLYDIDKDFPIPDKARSEAKAVAQAAVDEYVRQGGKREDV